jgi:hypothetical protein
VYLADPDAADKRRTLERRIESAKVLQGRPRLTRFQLDGILGRMSLDMGRRYSL